MRMADSHSFTEYVAQTFDNQFWAAEEFLREDLDDLDIELYKIHRVKLRFRMLMWSMYGVKICQKWQSNLTWLCQ